MSLVFGRARRYDRKRSLERASRARARGRTRKAISHYREVLAQEPHDAEVHRKVAPLLAAGGDPEESWLSYRFAVRHLQRAGFLAQASGVLREAAASLPSAEVWEELAQVESDRGRPADAHAALLEGRRRFRGRSERPHAIRLLLAARRLQPHHFEANFDLAGLLAREGARPQAEQILERLTPRASGRGLRRIRARQLRLAPSPRRLWRWLRACCGRR